MVNYKFRSISHQFKLLKVKGSMDAGGEDYCTFLLSECEMQSRQRKTRGYHEWLSYFHKELNNTDTHHILYKNLHLLYKTINVNCFHTK